MRLNLSRNSLFPLLILGIVIGNCLKGTRPSSAEKDAASSGPERVTPELSGLHNLWRINDRLYSGSEPKEAEALAQLAQLGIKTIISVDGIRPNLVEARKQGLRYIHIPIGYDGIPASAAAALTRAARECDAPIYVHCHHGKHRGPAAAAVICRAQGASAEESRRILESAGTGKEYAGLWRDVAAFQVPETDASWPDLVEAAEVDDLAAAMAKLDRHWDRLKLCRDADWKSPVNQPELVPAYAALLVREALQEAHRVTPAEQADDQFHVWFEEAKALSQQLEEGLRQQDFDVATSLSVKLESTCQLCHQGYRN